MASTFYYSTRIPLPAEAFFERQDLLFRSIGKYSLKIKRGMTISTLEALLKTEITSRRQTKVDLKILVAWNPSSDRSATSGWIAIP
jgi:hypothetical protein